MGRPILLEGEAGVGKTEIAKVLAATLGRKLIRLQCYEGLDVSSAVYEWNYAGQMMAIRLAEAEGVVDRARLEEDIFSERYLVKRPLLQALAPDPAGPPILLIDELDRTDEAFEAFLLEVLGDFQVTIPELGTIKAEHPPIVIVTSNRTREIHDALKRRCLYHWVGYPDAERELQILRAKAPQAPARLSQRDRRLRPGHPRPGPVQGARRRRDAGLGHGAGGTRRRRPRPHDGVRHAGRAAEIPGRHPEDAGREGEGVAGRIEAGSDEQGEGDLRLSVQSHRPGGAP